MKEEKTRTAKENKHLKNIATSLVATITALNFACSSQDTSRTRIFKTEYPTISCPYSLDLDRDGCADRIIVGNEGIYVQTHSIFEYGQSNGFKEPQLVVPLDHKLVDGLTDILITHVDHDGILDIMLFIKDDDCPSGRGFRKYVAFGKGDGTFYQPEKHHCNVIRDFAAQFYKLEL